MYCKYCGKKIDDDSTYCAGCGAKLAIALPKAAVSSGSVQTAPKKAVYHRHCEEEFFEPTFKNIVNQFSPFGKIIFVVLCVLMAAWSATLTFCIFYPEYIDFISCL